MNSSALVPDDAGQRRESETLLEYQGYRILLRPLSLRDLAAIREQETLEAVTGQLLRRAVVTASVQVEDLPEAVLAEIAEQMPVLDPHSELRLSLTCPDCGRKWISLIDIAALVKDEIAACAGKVMEEVHVLATAYGWSEQEILALHPKRREFLLANGVVVVWASILRISAISRPCGWGLSRRYVAWPDPDSPNANWTS